MNPREEIKEMAPELSRWNQGEGYTIPNDYFEKFSERIIDRVKESEELKTYFDALPNQVMDKIKKEKKSKVYSLRSFIQYGAVAAALLVVGSLVWSNMSISNPDASFSLLNSSEDLDYIIDEIAIEEIFDSEFIDDELLDEILVSEEENYSIDDTTEDLFLDAEDELLEEFL